MGCVCRWENYVQMEGCQAMSKDKLRELLSQLWIQDISADEAFDELEDLINHIKRLEEAGDRMFEIGKRIVHQNGEDMYWIRKLEEELTEWIATKEVKL